MKIMGTEGVSEEVVKPEGQLVAEPNGDTSVDNSDKNDEQAKKEFNPMDPGALSMDSMVPKAGAEGNDVKITAEEKVRFLDAMIANDRFTIEYNLFAGKVRVTVRSMTFEETRALSEWCIKVAPKDVGGQISGKFRRFLLLAQVAEFNGTKFDPLAQPLFSTVGSDGKEVEPGWVDQAKYWDDKPTVVISAISKCVADFNVKYELMTSKAEDVNFWNPDMH